MELHKIFSKYVVGDVILDIGFAQKPNNYLINKRVYGIDVQNIKKPKGYIETKVVNLNKESIPYIDGYFDSVILGDVIEHVENPSFLLRESNRVLKKNGCLIVSTPHANYIYDILKNFLFSFFRIDLDKDPGQHISNWTILDFKRLLKKNSFKIEKIKGGYIHLLKINIPLHFIPFFCWQIIYICKKEGEPKRLIYTRTNVKKVIINESNFGDKVKKDKR